MELDRTYQDDVSLLRNGIRADFARDLDAFLSRVEKTQPSTLHRAALAHFATEALERHWHLLSNDEKQTLGKVKLRCAIHATSPAVGVDIEIEYSSLRARRAPRHESKAA